MYKVMLVDDEPWVIYGLKMMLSWEEYGFEIAAEAVNGLEALDILQNEKLDVVFSDIRMPGMDGLRLTDEVAMGNLETKVVLISGYGEFEYAQKAIKYGVFEYLLKKVKAEDLKAVLIRLKQELDAKNEKKKQDEGLERLMEAISVEEKISAESLLAETAGRHLGDTVTLACIDMGTSQAAERFMKFSAGKLSLAYLVGESRILLLCGDEFPGRYIQESSTAGYSRRNSSSAWLAQMYQEADLALKTQLFTAETGCCQYKIEDNNRCVLDFLLECERILEEKQKSGMNLIIDNLDRMVRGGRLYINQLAVIYNQLIAMSHKFFKTYMTDVELNFMTTEQMITEYHNWAELKKNLESQMGIREEQDVDKVSGLIHYVLENIDEKYDSDISLQELSEKYNISTGHLSSLIKRETGQTYTEHIIRRRIQKAKVLLEKGNMSVNEIAEAVGYSDYFYFTKLFTKTVGLSPSKYRRNYIKKQ